MFNYSEIGINEQKAGLYIHIPFCIQKCNYCDFYSITKTEGIDKFVDYLIKEIQLFSELNEKKFDANTIFFGGGTPSLLEPHHLEKIFNSVFAAFNVDVNSEITIETNPGTIDIRHLREIKKMGINRISFGVQSFNDEELLFLNRIHTSQEAIKSIEYARNVGFDNISLDLIFGIPNQTISSWKNNLQVIKDLEIQHLSVYNLIFEENTPLHRQLLNGTITQLDESIEETLYLNTIDYLHSINFYQYELSNFAKNGFECKHNIKYWTHFPYFGFGPSAHSYYELKRFWNYRNLNNYYTTIDQKQLPVEDSEVLDNYKYIIEKIMLGLRYQGINLNFISDIISEDINQFIEQNIIPIKNYFQPISDKIILSKDGFFKLNEIAVKFINQIDLKKI